MAVWSTRQDEMLGTGREEILECEERYGQRRKGKSSLRKALDEKPLLRCTSSDNTLW